MQPVAPDLNNGAANAPALPRIGAERLMSTTTPLQSDKPDVTAAISVELVHDRMTWDQLLDRAPFPHLPQGFAYGEGKRAKGWHVQRAIFRRGDRVLAFATVLERRIFGLPVIARVNRGPVFLAPSPGPDETVAVYAALRRRWHGMLLIAPALLSGEASNSILQRAGYRRRHDMAWMSGRIDLGQTEAELWAGFASTFRNRARQAEKLGATLRIAEDAASYRWMVERHVQNMVDKGFSAADATLAHAMREAAPENVTVFQLMHEGAPVAGMSVVRFGHCAEYHLGWFGPEGRRLNAGNFLMWEIIKTLRARGISEFDVGGLREGDGYTRFKQTMRPLEFRLAGEWMPAWIPWRAR